MQRIVTALGMAGVSMLLVAPVAKAADAPCGQFTLTGGYKTVDIVDLGTPGTSIGDFRIAERVLEDSDGKRVGSLIGETVILRVSDDKKHAVMGDWRIRINGSTLVTGALYARDNETSQFTPALDVAILGGTGTYRGAYGTLEIASGERPAYHFDITCRE